VNLSSAALYEIDRGYNQFQNNSNLSFDAKKLIFHRGRLELESSCDSNGSRQSVVIRQRWTLFGSIEFQEFVNIETNWVKYQPHFKRPQTVQGGGAPTTLTRNNDESKEVEEEKEVKENEDNGYESHTPSPCPSQTVSGKMIARVSTSAKHEVSRNIKVDDGKLDIGASSSSGTPQRPSLVNITTIASVSAVLNEKPRSQSTAAPNSELETIWSELSHKMDPAKKWVSIGSVICINLYLCPHVVAPGDGASMSIKRVRPSSFGSMHVFLWKWWYFYRMIVRVDLLRI